MFSRTIRTLTHRLSKNASFNNINVVAKRNSGFDGWVYRQKPIPSAKWKFVVADTINCIMWWWIFVHVYYDWGHIVGEFTFPEPETWTDAELGVVDE